MTLPSKIVNMKFDQLDNEQKEVYFIFLRKDICYQDTYYMFKGTESMFNNSIEKLRAEVIAIKNSSQADEDELLDTPMDTWSSLENGDIKSHWICYDFDSAEDYEGCYNFVRNNGKKNSYFKRCEIRDIGGYTPMIPR
jgi:hypothetical protein